MASVGIKYSPAYAIIRVDHYLETTDINTLYTVKKIVKSIERAEEEVQRLNDLNKDKKCKYFFQYTRIERDDK